jgi:hypothetical protein
MLAPSRESIQFLSYSAGMQCNYLILYNVCIIRLLAILSYDTCMVQWIQVL